jgi:Mg-chelatase subunit ChlD
MDGSSRPSWRKGARAPRRSDAPRGEPASASWQTRRADSRRRLLAGNRAKIFLFSLAALVLVIWFVVAVFWTGIRTPLLAIGITQYAAPLPPNAYAMEDITSLETTNPRNITNRPLRQGGTREDCRRFLESQLTSQRPGGPKRDVVLIYLSAHGVVNEQNEPCLLFGDAEPLDDATWLPIRELFEWLKKDQERLETAKRKIVLLLDAGRIEDDWGLGILYNGFAELLAEAWQRADVPRLYVLNAASAGQVSWPAPELNGTVFGHFVAQALAGAARGRDNKVTLRELFEYLQAQITPWTVRHRDDVQQPLLIPEIGPEQDFPIVFAGGAAAPNGFGPEDAASRHEQIARRLAQTNQLWKLREQRLAERPVLRVDPLGLAASGHRLLRAEQLALAGTAYEAEFESARAQIEGALRDLGDSHLPEQLEVFSLPLAHQIGRIPETAQELDTAFAAWSSAGGRPKAKPDTLPPPGPRSYGGAATIGLRWLSQQAAPPRSQLQEVLGLIDEFKAAGSSGESRWPGPDVSEVQWLRLLERHADWDAGPPVAARLVVVLGGTISLQQEAERAAAPDDVRTHHWVQPLVDEADVMRRVAQDWVLVGDAPALDKAAAGVRDASAAYTAALERGATISAALELRDRVWSELPDLARWVGSRLRRSSHPETAGSGTLENASGAAQLDAEVLSYAFLTRLVLAAREFSVRLDGGLTRGERWPPAGLEDAQRETATRFAALRQNYQAHCEQLKSAADDRPTLRNILAALQTPLLAADRRQALTEKLCRVMFLEAGSAESEPLGSAARETTTGDVRSLRHPDCAKQLADLTRHPALELLDRSQALLLPEAYRHAVVSRKPQDGESPLVWLARQGGELRRLLADLRGALRELEDETNRRLKEATESPANTRAGLGEADRLARAAAPLWTTRTWENPALDTARKDDRREQDPARRLTSFDRHWQLLWHARRNLGDCWGAAKVGPLVPYFADVADRYLAAAGQLEAAPRSLRYGGEILKDVKGRRLEALKSQPVQAGHASSLGGECSVRHQSEVRWPRDLPAGVAALFLHAPPDDNARTRLLPVLDQATAQPVRRYACEVGGTAGSGPAPPQYQLAKEDAVGGKVFVSVLFRGHLWGQEFTIREPRYIVRTEMVPPRPNTAKVTVLGRGKRTAHILFVFDCSGSMNKQNDKTKRRRIDTARESLDTLLQAMLTESKLAGSRYEVGLRAYGHRVRFTRGAPYCDKDPKDSRIHPDLDVQVLAGMRPLTAEHYALCQKQLRPLQPWGQTPLYYALQLAFDENDFQGIPADDPKHIMVITDGANFQTECLAKQEAGRPTRPNDVLRARDAAANGQYRNTQIDIIGLDMDDPSQELRKLAEATGGRYYDAENDTESLLRQLREVIRRLEYSVSPAAESAPPERKPLGDPCHLTGLTPQPSSFVVRLFGASRLPPPQELVLEGGEAVELEYRDRDNLLVFPPYDPRSFDPRDDKRGAEYALKDPHGGALCRVQAMLPRRVGKDVEFYVYVQRQAEAEFTRRPAHVWAEIRPATGEDRRYVFYDPDFVPERPVPVFRFVAADWPATASKAEIKLWLQFAAASVKPDAEETVNPVQRTVFQVSSLPGHDFGIRCESLSGQGYRVIVRERQPAGTALTQARVSVQPPPHKITHRYYVGVDMAQHEFDYPRQTPAVVHVTARAKITDPAIAVPPLVVMVPE